MKALHCIANSKDFSTLNICLGSVGYWPAGLYLGQLMMLTRAVFAAIETLQKSEREERETEKWLDEEGSDINSVLSCSPEATGLEPHWKSTNGAEREFWCKADAKMKIWLDFSFQWTFLRAFFIKTFLFSLKKEIFRSASETMLALKYNSGQKKCVLERK